MRRTLLVGVLVVVVGFAAWLAWAEWSAYNNPTSSTLSPGMQCVVTGEGVVSTDRDVRLEMSDGSGLYLAPGVLVRVGGDPAADKGGVAWARPIPVVIESGKHRGAEGTITREHLRPVR